MSIIIIDKCMLLKSQILSKTYSKDVLLHKMLALWLMIFALVDVTCEEAGVFNHTWVCISLVSL